MGEGKYKYASGWRGTKPVVNLSKDISDEMRTGIENMSRELAEVILNMADPENDLQKMIQSHLILTASMNYSKGYVHGITQAGVLLKKEKMTDAELVVNLAARRAMDDMKENLDRLKRKNDEKDG